MVAAVMTEPEKAAQKLEELHPRGKARGLYWSLVATARALQGDAEGAWEARRRSHRYVPALEERGWLEGAALFHADQRAALRVVRQRLEEVEGRDLQVDWEGWQQQVVEDRASLLVIQGQLLRDVGQPKEAATEIGRAHV